MMSRLGIGLQVLCLFLALFAVSSLGLAEESKKGLRVHFEGELIDQEAMPISGIFYLEFRIFPSAISQKALVVERHFVSVVDGRYQLILGEAKPVETKANVLYVGVYFERKLLTRVAVPVLMESLEKFSAVERDAQGKVLQFGAECPAGYRASGVRGSLAQGLEGLSLLCRREN